MALGEARPRCVFQVMQQVLKAGIQWSSRRELWQTPTLLLGTQVLSVRRGTPAGCIGTVQPATVDTSPSNSIPPQAPPEDSSFRSGLTQGHHPSRNTLDQAGAYKGVD